MQVCRKLVHVATILIVDDDSAIAALLAEYALDYGHTAILAPNGLEGLARATQTLPALVISDVMMPFMDGFTMLQHLRNNPTFANTPIYLMSAVDIHRRNDAVAELATGWITKPFALTTLDTLFESLQHE